MKKVKEIIFLDKEDRSSRYSTGIMFIFEDGTSLEQMSTDPVGN